MIKSNFNGYALKKNKFLDSEDYYLPTRKKFRTNPLLIRSAVGKHKPFSYNLPPKSYTYGKLLPKKKIPTSQIINGWNIGIQTPDERKIKRKKNFVNINRRALKRGCVTAKQINDFRKEKKNQKLSRTKAHAKAHSYRNISRAKSTKARNVNKKMSTNKTQIHCKSQVFGKPSKIADVNQMNDIMQMNHHRQWLQTQVQMFADKRKKKRAQTPVTFSAKCTTASKRLKQTNASSGHALYMSRKYKQKRNKAEKADMKCQQRYRRKYAYVQSRLVFKQQKRVRTPG